jgi:hypothetical protein
MTFASLRRALSPTFRAGELVFFIPWWGVAENPARRILLLDLPGPAPRLLADVADLHFSDIPVRGGDGARSARTARSGRAVAVDRRRRFLFRDFGLRRNTRNS